MAFNLCLQYFAALIKAIQDKINCKKVNDHNVYEKSTVEIDVLTFLSRLSIMVLISAIPAQRLERYRHSSFGRFRSRPS